MAVPSQITFFEHASGFTGIIAYADLMSENFLPIGEDYFRVPDSRDYNLPPSRPVENGTQGEKCTWQISPVIYIALVFLKKCSLRMSKARNPSVKEVITNSIAWTRFGKVLCATLTQRLRWGYPNLDEEGNILSYYYTDWQQPHQCKNWEAVKEWFYEHRDSDKHGLVVT